MKWILCDERLPKEGQMVLTTIRGHDVIIVQDEETFEEAIERVWNEVCYVSVGFIGSDGWYGADGYPLIVHPIAWMPLPQPYIADRKTEPSDSEKPNNCEPSICDTCRYYNSNIPCGSTPSACKEADKFAEEFVDGLKKLKQTEPTSSKMEQVDEPKTQMKTQNSNLTFEKQTDCAWK